ncbi:MAG: hypothetical protein ACI4O4_12085 [Candidatus Ventricola sp.]
MTKPPPKIKHIYIPDISNEQRQEIAMAAANNVRLSARATKLLLFYCNQANGFAPALKLIERKTGIAPNKVSEIRQELVKKSLIAYQQQALRGKIVIDWLHLSAFALMDRRMGKQESLRGYFGTVAPALPSPTIRQLNARIRPTALQQLQEPPQTWKQSNAPKDIIKVLESLTEAEYSEMVKAFPEYVSAEQRPMLPIQISKSGYITIGDPELDNVFDLFEILNQGSATL